MVKALEAKNYLPYRAASPWAGLWKHALYRLRLEISERLEGNYLASENRLTQIQVHLTLTEGGVQKWQSIPTARTSVPLPKLPAYLSSRLAARPDRSEEVEHLLYTDAGPDRRKSATPEQHRGVLSLIVSSEEPGSFTLGRVSHPGLQQDFRKVDREGSGEMRDYEPLVA